MAAGKTNHELLKVVELYHNQFHIQAINIHHLKHAIKHHISETEHHPNFGHRIPYHKIDLDFKTLTNRLDQLKSNFLQFIQSV